MEPCAHWLHASEKDNDNPEPETNRFVLSGKNYSNFTVSVAKDELNRGNYDIHILPAEDNTMELCLQCSMQHDGVSLDLTKVDPLLAVQDYKGWYCISVRRKILRQCFNY